MSGFRHNPTVSGSPSHSNRCDYSDYVTKHLHRYYGTHDLHFITSSCYRRQPELGSAWRRDLFVKILEEARRKYRFVVHGYVVMPEHFHLLIAEPEVGDPSVVMKVIKERFSRALHKNESGEARIWQKRLYDFNLWSDRKRIEKLRYMHRNPVKRGLVDSPEEWKWSSFRAYLNGEAGLVRVNFQEWRLEIRKVPHTKFGDVATLPLIRKKRE